MYVLGFNFFLALEYTLSIRCESGRLSLVSDNSIAKRVLCLGWLFQVMILSQDKDRGRISLSTKKLEPTPGDMLRNPQLVYEKVSHPLQRLFVILIYHSHLAYYIQTLPSIGVCL